jgi:hypothetical protein
MFDRLSSMSDESVPSPARAVPRTCPGCWLPSRRCRLGVRSPWRQNETIALREVILHMIEEYARHVGHADLLRERIDGRVGQLYRPVQKMSLCTIPDISAHG